MNLLKALKKLIKQREPVGSAYFARKQFRELAKRNLSIPVKLYHL